jgi:SAM-dependent methyltransferase
LPGIARAEPDGRLFAPSFDRNHAPIAEALAPWLAVPGPVLEIGCGTGQHTAVLAAAHPDCRFLPTDIFPEHRASAVAWARAGGLGNVLEPRHLDAALDWAPAVADVAPFAMVLAINVVHIAPWAVTEGLIRGAAAVLAPGGTLALYGPYIEADRPLAESNAAFDASLRARDPAWGLRRVTDLAALAAAAGFGPATVIPRPANNIVLGFRRAG